MSLSLDNGDDPTAGQLSEVTITRRLYRDGTSEYEVNGAPCRLLDIQELLADSGVGRHQHVIIGQGRVDSVLNAGPEEHRAVIEEAAGVVKHRSRRDRSIRRLEATDMDVARLRDILEEQQRHLKPLKRQASAASQYDSVRANGGRWSCGSVVTASAACGLDSPRSPPKTARQASVLLRRSRNATRSWHP